ncbi:hypothetical protein [Thalassomonas haliotis]|uniref:Uncharacterized protein n=1 Tax=Thalassomonas haliotis TaxID=485448 RepID=A0ABY7VCK9_9GAMM|nr:hypothetical protein [Thalassomonas haliotis]WDE11402.1 hypothetical protein H3N35_24815 [Thalassomonas haliotis]
MANLLNINFKILLMYFIFLCGITVVFSYYNQGYIDLSWFTVIFYLVMSYFFAYRHNKSAKKE